MVARGEGTYDEEEENKIEVEDGGLSAAAKGEVEDGRNKILEGGTTGGTCFDFLFPRETLGSRSHHQMESCDSRHSKCSSKLGQLKPRHTKGIADVCDSSEIVAVRCDFILKCIK